jgi:hypothetical protein
LIAFLYLLNEVNLDLMSRFPEYGSWYFPDVVPPEVAWMCAAPIGETAAGGRRAAGDALAVWAEHARERPLMGI